MIMDGYVRISRVNGRDGENYLSPTIQQEAIERWAEYAGVEIGHIFTDEDWSGGSSDRPGLNQAIERALSGETGGIISWKIDRFSRNTEDGLRELRRLREKGARLVFTTEQIDTDSIYGEMTYTILLAVATAFLQNIKASWVEVKGRAIGRGVHIGPTPYGYLRDDSGRLEIDPQKGPLVTEAFRRAATRGLSAAQAYLIEQDDSRGWTTTQVRRILSNDVYLGRVRQRAGKVYDTDVYARDEYTHPELTTRPIWEAAQDRPMPRAAAAVFPLSGILTCASCGQHMVGARGGNNAQRIYRCAGSLKTAKHRCLVDPDAGKPGPAIVSAHLVEPFVLEVAQDLVSKFTITIGNGADLDDLELAIVLAREELRAFASDLTMRRALGDDYHPQLQLRVQAVEDAEEAYRAACKAAGATRTYTAEELAEDTDTLRAFLSDLYRIEVKRGRGLKIQDRVDFLALNGDRSPGMALT